MCATSTVAHRAHTHAKDNDPYTDTLIWVHNHEIWFEFFLAEIRKFWWMKLVWRCFAIRSHTHKHTQMFMLQLFHTAMKLWTHLLCILYICVWRVTQIHLLQSSTPLEIQHHHRHQRGRCVWHMNLNHLFLRHFFPIIILKQMHDSCVGQHEIALVVAQSNFKFKYWLNEKEKKKQQQQPTFHWNIVSDRNRQIIKRYQGLIWNERKRKYVRGGGVWVDGTRVQSIKNLCSQSVDWYPRWHTTKQHVLSETPGIKNKQVCVSHFSHFKFHFNSIRNLNSPNTQTHTPSIWLPSPSLDLCVDSLSMLLFPHYYSFIDIVCECEIVCASVLVCVYLFCVSRLRPWLRYYRPFGFGAHTYPSTHI